MLQVFGTSILCFCRPYLTITTSRIDFNMVDSRSESIRNVFFFLLSILFLITLIHTSCTTSFFAVFIKRNMITAFNSVSNLNSQLYVLHFSIIKNALRILIILLHISVETKVQQVCARVNKMSSFIISSWTTRIFKNKMNSRGSQKVLKRLQKEKCALRKSRTCSF